MKKVASILGLVALVLPATAWGYRTAEDSPEFEGAGRVGWAVTEYPIRLQLYARADMHFSVADAYREVADAALSWNYIGCGEPQVEFVGLTQAAPIAGDGLNTVRLFDRFLDDWTKEGFPKDAAAVTILQYEQNADSQWEIVEGDIYLNGAQYIWYEGSGLDYPYRSMRAVLLHEMGHFFGLLHSCEVEGTNGAPPCESDPSFEATQMHPLYADDKLFMSKDDIAGICYLYPGGICPPEGCPEDQVCAMGCREDCGGNLCHALYACVDETCIAGEVLALGLGGSSGTAGAGAGAGAAGAAGERSEGSGGEAGHSISGAGGTERASENPEGGEEWDPCTVSDDCSEGLFCAAEGYCAPYCIADSDCSEGETCKGRRCVPSKGVFGAECESPGDCNSGICLTADHSCPV